ncbi:RhuM family protein [Chitinophaga sp. S165]|uniref:RhuM family protein n=1 Tax=Chitinophaga sp. S165 TaxID=2135462 RepID=UPI0018EE91D3
MHSDLLVTVRMFRDEIATTRKIRVVQKEGSREVKREVDFYNLDIIIAVGYRVNSFRY